jgi:hypothetical protein
VTTLAKTIEIRRKGNTSGFALFIDGLEFPWHIERQDVELINMDPLYVLRIGILAEQVTGADEFNEQLAEESDSSRVRYADARDLRIEGIRWGR